MAITTLGDNFRVIIEGGSGARFAGIAEGFANDAEAYAADAAGFSGLVYANQAAGEAATATGDFFLVWNGDTPRTYTHYERTSGSSAVASPPLTSASLAATTGSELVGRPQGTLSEELDQWIDIGRYASTAAGLRSALEDAMSSGKTLYIHGSRTIDGWASPLDTTAALTIRGDGMATSRLTFTTESASLLHVLHNVTCEGVAFVNHTANTSSNGGAIFYNLDSTDSAITAVRLVCRGVEFSGCKAPINIESPHADCLIETCKFDTATGHQLRFGTSGAVAKWGTWKNTVVRGNVFKTISAISSGNNVYAVLAYGTDTVVEGNYIDGLTGNGAEVGGIHCQATGYRINRNTIRNFSTGTVVRGIMLKGESAAENVQCVGNMVFCGGAALSEGIALYFKSGVVSGNQIFDPGQAGFSSGTSCNRTEMVVCDNRVKGTNVSGVPGISLIHDSGVVAIIDNEIVGFTKPITVDVRTGAGRLTLDNRISGSAGTGVEVYLTNDLPSLELSGEIEITDSSYCIWTRGPGTIARASIAPRLLKCSSGFGWRNEATITEAAVVINGVEGVTTIGREVSLTKLPSRGTVRVQHSATLTNSSATDMMSIPVANNSAVMTTFSATANLSTDSNAYIRRAKATASGGTAAIGTVQDAFTDEDNAGWDATLAVTGATLVPRVTGANGVKVDMVTELIITS